ncbi:MAG TPA: hypothetical protein PKC21_00855 [Oligoflexia bacterium]|nr:hypothetical protein [Oligoflexia bacterium]HMR23878.1 hypothetical protein [Oligoflexia bacterium]
MKKNNRRPLLKRFWSNKGFQAKYSLLVVTITTLITLIFSYLYYKNEMVKTEILGIQNSELLQMIQGNDNRLIMYLIGFFVFQFLMVFVLGVLLTHKVAGPLHRMEKYLQELNEGKMPYALSGSRKGDEFKSLFNAFVEYNNNLIEKNKKS